MNHILKTRENGAYVETIFQQKSAVLIISNFFDINKFVIYHEKKFFFRGTMKSNEKSDVPKGAIIKK